MAKSVNVADERMVSINYGAKGYKLLFSRDLAELIKVKAEALR